MKKILFILIGFFIAVSSALILKSVEDDTKVGVDLTDTSVVYKSPTKGATADTLNVSCSLSATVITNPDTTKHAKFSWSITNNTFGFIDNGVGWVQAYSGNNMVGPAITKNTTYTLTVANGIATSTCSTSVTP